MVVRPSVAIVDRRDGARYVLLRPFTAKMVQQQPTDSEFVIVPSVDPLFELRVDSVETIKGTCQLSCDGPMAVGVAEKID